MTLPVNLDGGFARQLPDVDTGLTGEWVDSLDAVIDTHGTPAARLVLTRLLHRAAEREMGFPTGIGTPYLNSIPPGDEPAYPGDVVLERRIEGLVRWNAAVMVTRANALSDGIGGHLSTPASAACLYEMGFNHFFRGKDDGQGGDQVFFQGHATPGIYARAFLEGRLDEAQLDGFRREIDGGGLSSYPHPRLMPEFWEFPTVSMGLGPINAIYQARFNRYLAQRGIVDTSRSTVWCFLGDGECDEPETLCALSLAAREGLDNLIFVVNCNLQRLDGPVRGNGKIIQELEAVFRGAGWNVAKVVWGARWEELLSADVGGALLDKMNATLDGEYQKLSVEGPAYVREHFFGADPRLQEMVAHLPDDDPVFTLPRGGHDRRKLYAAYTRAVEHTGAPTVVLAKTLKGSRLGSAIESRNAAHQMKKIPRNQLASLRDRLGLADRIPDEALTADLPPYVRLPAGSEEERYLHHRRRALGGSVPRRVVRSTPPGQPAPAVFDDLLGGSGNRAVSTTMAFAGLLRSLLRDDTMGSRVVPIVPDEARTFGLDSLFSEVKIYAHKGQRYDPVDGAMKLAYRESEQGQILEEGITEAGSMASFAAAGTAYATWGEAMIPFYIFYSMFGFQRVGDLIWAFGDVRGRGFLLGATAGRTTLNGEGLQHQDGHSLVLASTVPNLAAYDPAFAYEVATIIRDGIRRMYGDDPEDVFYYLTLYNENYPMPAMPPGPAGPGSSVSAEEGILRGIYRFAPAPDGGARPATILFSGTAHGAAREARQLLAEHHDVAAELWSVTSYKALREDALAAVRWNRLHPTDLVRTPYLTEVLSNSEGPTVAVTDFMKAVPDQVSQWVPGHMTTLGTDGYGRSDARAALRRHFETDAAHVVVAVLAALADTGHGKGEEVADAIARYGIDPEAREPLRA
ncbi:MAG TPA: pyruvate dehydrogenase (acetyl-transferring), homodimeric type [Acidimicrobiales bacterium]|nr:pyruvate dehydrogenase (acetyl-transferring), homodimeric type [Acidimicrobiales bacterium]